MDVRLKNLQDEASWLRTKIKTCLRNDNFFDAEKYEAELDVVEDKIEMHTENL